jgi:predicted DNA-binding protein with PD1-like motif
VKTARVGYYDQQTREYQFHQLDQPMEILNLAGNVSLKDGEPIVHAHITLADENGNAYGGHLAAGTVVFACECLVQELVGDELNRGLDEQTGLPLWKS